MTNLFLYILIIFSSLFFTEVIRRFSLKKNLLDTPNSRSSHSSPTPHGGGLAIVLCFLLIIGFSRFLPNSLVYALIASGVLVAATGFWDDHSHIYQMILLN